MDLELFVPLTVIRDPGKISSSSQFPLFLNYYFYDLQWVNLRIIYFCFHRRDKILSKLRSEGVNCGGCGDNAIRLRPALVFQPKHANIFLEKLEKVLNEI